MNTLVLGIGNTLLHDEGVGVYAARYLQNTQAPNPEIRYIDGGTLSFPLAVAIRDSDNLIVIDAAELHSEPGTIAMFKGFDMDLFVASHRNSKTTHEVGLADLLSITRMTDDLPHNRALICIQPRDITWGESLSSDVIASLPIACNMITQLIVTWKQ